MLSPTVLDLIEGDHTVWERGPLETLAQRDELRAYDHRGFWQPMDTVRERIHLEQLWETRQAPWKVWP